MSYKLWNGARRLGLSLRNFHSRRPLLSWSTRSFAVAFTTTAALCSSHWVYLQSSHSTEQEDSAKVNDELSLEVLFDPIRKVDFHGRPPTILGWSKRDSECYLEQKCVDGRTQLMRVNAHTGEQEVVIDALPAFTKLEGEELALKIVGHLLPKSLNTNEDTALYDLNGALFYYNSSTNTAVRVTPAGSPPVSCPKMSPDGRRVAFVKDNDLYVYDFESASETRLTQTGSDTMFNGKLDWVYQEEVFGRGKFTSHWWSPDSSHIAFLELDDSNIPECHGVVDNSKVHAMCEITRYPQPGDPNPLVRLGVCNVNDSLGKSEVNPKFLHTAPKDTLVCRVKWVPDSSGVMFQTQNRQQTWLDLNCAHLASGEVETLFRETTPAWVDITGNPKFLVDGSFLWVSHRSGQPGVYRYSRDGKCKGSVLEGFGFSKLHGVSKRAVYFSGCADLRNLEQHVYRLDLVNGEVVPLTRTAGTHDAKFNQDFSLFVDSFSDVLNPVRTSIFDSMGRRVREVDSGTYHDVHKRYLSNVRAPEFVQAETRDGAQLEAMLILPQNMQKDKRYPVICYQYSGPSTPLVKHRWGGMNYLWHQMMANKGYIIWICDVRTASGKAGSVWDGYRRFGELEMKDVEDWVAHLRSLDYVDNKRLGIWGWSFGGYMTAYAMTHSNLFKCGVSGAPVTDWTLYDSIYTERYMDTPENNPEGYEQSSVTHAAQDLSGKLLLIHGTLDDNVHIQNSIQLIHELQKNNIPFEFMCYPNSRHGVDSSLVPHYRALVTDFFERSL